MHEELHEIKQPNETEDVFTIESKTIAGQAGGDGSDILFTLLSTLKFKLKKLSGRKLLLSSKVAQNK